MIHKRSQYARVTSCVRRWENNITIILGELCHAAKTRKANATHSKQHNTGEKTIGSLIREYIWEECSRLRRKFYCDNAWTDVGARSRAIKHFTNFKTVARKGLVTLPEASDISSSYALSSK